MIKRRLSRNSLATCVRLASFSLLVAASGCSETNQSSVEQDRAEISSDAKANPNAGPVAGPSAAEVLEVTDAEAENAAQRLAKQVNLQMSEGLDVQLWATDRLLSDPTAISVDYQGRVWTAITNRSNNSEFDIRGYSDWEIPSMTFETVEDRREFLRKELAPEKSDENQWLPDRNNDGSRDWRDLAVVAEEIVRIEDTTGNGRANRSQVFLRDFNSEVTDAIGGVYYHNDLEELFVGVAPSAWRVTDTDQDGIADQKSALSYGFGVHIGFSGHGMSGMTVGPDGRIYYGIGDIGASITGPDGQKWHFPNQGVIVRSEPDGSNLEVFAAGLRNTYEFVFDKYGNLITVDNDGDHEGEHERLVYLIDGSDSGWRTNWQLGKYKDPKNNKYKVWMDEDYFKPHFEGQAAHLLPPIAPYHSGPSGMSYNPGTALSDEWKDHFFLVEFVGTESGSGIDAFTLEPKGASFELATDQKIFRGAQITGIDFGPDGALYAADWTQGWMRDGKGRIWKMDTPDTAGSDTRKETQQLLSGSFAEHSLEQLVELLAHADMRVRSKAQFTLVDRSAVDELAAAAASADNQLARIHAFWGLGQLSRRDPAVAEDLVQYLDDEDAEIRAQVAELLGDIAYAPATQQLIEQLQDDEPRTVFFAAQALGRIGAADATQPLITMLAANAGEDIYLAQAGAIALARIGDEAALAQLAEHESMPVRRGAVVALRRLHSPALAQFLQDDDEYVVTDAARAISDDTFVTEAFPALAAMLEQSRFTNEPLLRRAINANLYQGGEQAAARLAKFASNTGAAAPLRAEALHTLAVWADSSIFDRVTGRHRGAVQNDPEVARSVLKPQYDSLLNDSDAGVREATIAALGQLSLRESTGRLVQVLEQDAEASVRQTALETLRVLNHAGMGDAVFTALNDNDQRVRMTALGMLPSLELPTEQVVEMHALLLQNGSVDERQAALTSLANVDAPQAHAVFAEQLKRLIEGDIAPEVQLELVTAAEKTGNAELQALLTEYENSKDVHNPLEVYQEALYGGDAAAGSELFRYNSTAQCVRCHVVGGQGSEVGPDLTDIGAKLSREILLEALVAPAARIAPGYGRITAVMADGRRVEGLFEAETEATMTIRDAQGQPHQVDKADVEKVETSASGMPPMGQLLSREQLRDIVEFLTTLRGQEQAPETH